MISKTRLMAYAVFLGIASGAVYAADTKSSDSNDYATLRGDPSPYQFRASDLIGADVVDFNNDDIGDVDDVVIERGAGGAKAILSIGGVLGLGEHLISVPFNELRISGDGDTVFMNATVEALKSRPAFVYNEGETRGKQHWERRFEKHKAMQERREALREEREDVQDAKRELEQELKDVHKLEKSKP